MVLVATTEPVAFFAYPDRPSVLVPDGCATVTLSDRGPTRRPPWRPWPRCWTRRRPGAVEPYAPAAAPSGKLDAWAMGAAIARHMPAAGSSRTTR
jgi:acetolactate synthase-1/2/3 large subunit